MVLYMRLVALCFCRSSKTELPLSRCALIMLRPINWACRVVLWCFGVWWIEEKFPPGTKWCGFGFLRRQSSPRIIVPTHNSVLDALYFGTRFLPVPVVRRLPPANPTPPHRLTAFLVSRFGR